MSVCEYGLEARRIAEAGLHHLQSMRRTEAIACFSEARHKLTLMEAFEKDDSKKRMYRSFISTYTQTLAQLQPAKKVSASLQTPRQLHDQYFWQPPVPMDLEKGACEDAGLEDALLSCLHPHRKLVSWADVLGQEAAVKALKEAVILPMKYPHLFQGPSRPWSTILLFGPPGTGKTLLAEALASESAAAFFAVSSADLLSKWVGQSERLVRALFRLAQQYQPSIIFLDEVDCLCSTRNDVESETARRVKTQLLVEIQAVSQAQSGVLLLAATNLPWELDGAFRRRFQQRIFVGLPDGATRQQLLLHLTREHNVTFTKEEIERLVALTDGFSASDVACLVSTAVASPLRELTSATHFQPLPHDGVPSDPCKTLWRPCAPTDDGAAAWNLEDLEPSCVRTNACTTADFLACLQACRSSIATADLERHLQWKDQYGQQLHA